jgi:Kelch motif
MYNDYLIVFGGIHEVTKELDDVQVFNLRNKKWVVLFEEVMHSPNRHRYGSILSASNQNSGRYGGFSNSNNSPTNMKKKQSFMYGQNLPFKIDLEV